MERRYDIDWIRSIDVLTIIFFHSLIIFITRESSIFFVRSGVNSVVCEVIEAFFSRFHMTLLFFLAGFSAYYSLRKRSVSQFFKNRVKKLFVPLVLVSIFLNPVNSYLYAIAHGSTATYWENYCAFFSGISEGFNGTTPGYSPMHVWFLLYLFLINLVLLPLFTWGKTEKAKRVFSRLADFFYKPYRMVLIMLPFPFIFLFDLFDEMNPIAYLYLFVAGFFFATSEKYQKALDRDKWGYIISSIVLMLLYELICFVFDLEGVSSQVQWGVEYLIKIMRFLPIYAILAAGHTWIPQKETKVLNYISKCNFFIYLIHMTTLSCVAYLVIFVFNMRNLFGFLLINVVTYILCFALYELFHKKN